MKSDMQIATELLEKALGSEKAMDVIGKLTASLQVSSATDIASSLYGFEEFTITRKGLFNAFNSVIVRSSAAR